MFLLTFLELSIVLLVNISPVILFLAGIIVFLGLRVARFEKWPRSKGIYCAFITATTVGYGVVHPTTSGSRVRCIIIAFIGLILTGILVALAFESLNYAADKTGVIDSLQTRFEFLRN